MLDNCDVGFCSCGSKLTISSFAVCPILLKTSQRYCISSSPWFLILANIDCKRAKASPNSGLPTKKLLFRYLVIHRI